MIKHASSAASLEFTLCSVAFDVSAVGDTEDDPVFAGPGEEVTCQECIQIVNYCRDEFSVSRPRVWIKKP